MENISGDKIMKKICRKNKITSASGEGQPLFKEWDDILPIIDKLNKKFPEIEHWVGVEQFSKESKKKKYPPRIIETKKWNYEVIVQCCGEQFTIKNNGMEKDTSCRICGKRFSMQLMDDEGKIIEFKKFGERLR